jgi:hypothetical protein
MTKSIGRYINRDTKEEYNVCEVICRTSKPFSTQVKVLPLNIYVTQSGDKVTKLNDDLSSFTLNESVIYKIKT